MNCNKIRLFLEKRIHKLSVNQKVPLIMITIASLVIVTSEAANVDYCDMPDCGAQHIGCDYWHQPRDPSCPRKTNNLHLNSSIIRHIVALHNLQRDLVAGGSLSNLKPAARMATMQWDDTLSQLAQVKTLKCNTIPDHCHPTNKFRYSGQILGMLHFLGDIEKLADYKIVDANLANWFKAGPQINQSVIDEFPANTTEPVAAFALLMNERNTHVGCGISHFKIGEEHRLIFVCDYATTNFIGLPTYRTSSEAGKSCKKKSSTYKNLCSEKEKYQYEPMAELENFKF